MVSVAEDQTACVWSLTNLPKLVGQFGQLPGVAVKENKGVLLVSQVQDDSPVRGKIEKGDVFEGLVLGDKIRPLKSFDEYDRAFFFAKPGTCAWVN